MITVVTPTYNREKHLQICYESLLKQTDKRFIWMIIDDGSVDNTEDIVNIWIKEKKIKIVYIKKKNGGKASALNIALENIITKYVVCLDSDDTFYENTIERALIDLDSIYDNDNICGLLALRNNPDGSVMGGVRIPTKCNYVTAQDIFIKLKLKTELICFYKTMKIKKYRFPVFKNEKFVSPAWMQYMITFENKFLVSQDSLCCCKYVEDGLTKNKKKVIYNNPKGYTCVKLISYNLSDTLPEKIKNGLMYTCGCFLSKDYHFLNDVNYKVLTVFLIPLGYIVKLIRFRNL